MKNYTPTVKVVACDLDSTVADTQHREHLAPPADQKANVNNWIPYSMACVDDTPIPGVVAALRSLKEAGHRIFFVSGRNIEAMEATQEWLIKHDIPFDHIRLHRENDLRHNGEYKAQVINSWKNNGFDVRLMLEDHISVCEIIEEKTGVPCLTVRPRYDDKVGVSFNLNQDTEKATP